MLEITIIDSATVDPNSYITIVHWPALPTVGEDIFITDTWYTVVRREWSTMVDWITVHESRIDPKNVGVTLVVTKRLA